MAMTEKRLIDANALTNKIEMTDWYHINKLGELVIGANSELYTSLFKADDIFKALNQAPIVDAVEVVHGRWVHKGAWHIECSECQYILAHIGEAKNYCPNCGADMRGESDGNL